MKIDIELTPQSIKQAINKLKQVQKLYTNGSLIQDFLEDVCMWVINKANWYLENADLGELVKLQIRNGWTYEITPNGAKILNNATMKEIVNKSKSTDDETFETVPTSVLVEFGVGIVGQSNAHPNASAEGYEYNLDTPAKTDGVWGFYTDEANLDLPQTALLSKHTFDTDHTRGKRGEGGYRLFVTTRGAKGVWYAYNAIVDAKIELQKPNGELAQKWKKLLERYIG